MKRNARKPLVGLLFGLFALTGLPGSVLSGCESPAQPSTPNATDTDIEDVVYEGLATDEALVILLGLEARSDPAQNVVVDHPAPQMSLPAASAATFAWHVGEMASLYIWGFESPSALYAPNPRLYIWGFGSPSASFAPNPSLYMWGVESPSALYAMLGPRKAYAHGAPVNGRGYFLVFSTASSPKLLRVFTTELTYTPDAAAWASLVSAGGPISLTITNAIFEDNRVAQDGGPFVGSAVSFSITP